jgi:hypothetical protein
MSINGQGYLRLNTKSALSCVQSTTELFAKSGEGVSFETVENLSKCWEEVKPITKG